MDGHRRCRHGPHTAVDGLCAVCLLTPSPHDYTILNVLGRGRHTVAYLAHRVASSELVVAKVGHTGSNGVQPLDRIQAAAARLTASRVASVTPLITVGVLDSGCPYLVRPFVHGENLRTFCERRGADRAARAHLLFTVEQVITAAHGAGVAHGSLTSSNVLVSDRAGNVVVTITDFGLRTGSPEADRDALHALRAVML